MLSVLALLNSSTLRQPSYNDSYCRRIGMLAGGVIAILADFALMVLLYNTVLKPLWRPNAAGIEPDTKILAIFLQFMPLFLDLGIAYLLTKPSEKMQSFERYTKSNKQTQSQSDRGEDPMLEQMFFTYQPTEEYNQQSHALLAALASGQQGNFQLGNVTLNVK